jgi:hypothetical protein
VYLIAALVTLVASAGPTPMLLGDGWEYYYQVETLYSHASPEIRPEDEAHVRAACGRHGWKDDAPSAYAYFTARPNVPGPMYPLHFWAYALSAVPARAILDRVGVDELACLQIVNVWWCLFGVTAILFFGSGSLFRRLVLAGLTAVGPPYFYWQYTGAELYTYGLMTAALVAVGRRWYPAAALLAALASFQNAPAGLLCGAAVLMAAAHRQWRSAALTFVAAAVSFLPFIFYKTVFDNWNPLTGFTDTSRISWVRAWSQVADLNQGLLPYVPFLVILGALGVVGLALRRSVDGLLVAASLVGMSMVTQTHINWNSATIGVQRYLVWMLPVLAWLAVEGVWPNRWGRVALVIGIVAHALLMEYNPGRGDGTHTPFTQWALDNHPQLYVEPEPEMFVERTLIRDGAEVVNGVPIYPRPPGQPPVLPFGYVAPDGRVTKLLVDAESVERLPQRYEVTPEYLEEVRGRVAGRSRPIYVHPPPGAVRDRK